MLEFIFAVLTKKTNMSTSFFSADNITDRKSEVSVVNETPESEIDAIYETERCLKWIEQGNYKRVMYNIAVYAYP